MDIMPRWSNSWRISALTKRSGSMGCGCHASGTAAWRGCVEGGCAVPELAPVAKLNPTLIPVEAADEVDEKDVERKLLLASPPAAGPVLVWNCPAPCRDASAAGTDPDKRVWRLKAPRETPPPASPTVAAVAAATEPAERNPEELPQRSTAGGKPPSRPMGPAVVVVAMVRLRRRAGSVSGASGTRLRVADPPQRRARVLEVGSIDQATVVGVLSDAACKYPRGATAEPWRPSPRAGESSPVGALQNFSSGGRISLEPRPRRGKGVDVFTRAQTSLHPSNPAEGYQIRPLERAARVRQWRCDPTPRSPVRLSSKRVAREAGNLRVLLPRWRRFFPD